MSKSPYDENPFANTSTGKYEPPKWLAPEPKSGGGGYSLAQQDESAAQSSASQSDDV